MWRVICAVFLVAGCASVEHFQRAVLTSDVEEAREIIAYTLSEAMGTEQVQLGADDLKGTGTVSVLPPRLTDFEMASPAMPRQFWLSAARGACYLIEHQTGRMEDRHGGLVLELENVKCREVLP